MVSVYSFCKKAVERVMHAMSFLMKGLTCSIIQMIFIYKTRQRLHNSEIDFGPLNCVEADSGEKLQAGFELHNKGKL